MNYGYFDDSAREYVITDPRTPAKWVNYVGTLAFGGIVDQTGGALLCAGDPGLNRILKYLPQLPASEPRGSTLYLRLRGPGGTRIVTPFFTPGLEPLDSYRCHVGLGYQRIVSEAHGIRVDATIFVPPGEPVELRDIRVSNVGPVPLEVDVVPLVEYTHFDALKQFTNADWVPQTMMSEADREPSGHVILRQFAFMRRETLHNFFTANLPVDSFETDRARFLGANEYATWQRPLALARPSFSSYLARRGDNVGALLVKLGTLVPGEERRVVTQLGQAKAADVAGIVARHRDVAEVDRAFQALRASWDAYLAPFSCRTPDPAFDSMVNVHNPRQCHTTLNWSRYLSLYQLGMGSRGLGFRDSSQDTMGAVMGAPGRVRGLLLQLLSVQRPDGSAMHQFYPLTMEADEGDAREHGGKLVYGDDHLWAILATCAYLKETGELGFLDVEVPYYVKGAPPAARPKASVLDHLRAALAYTKANVGRHGLPLLGFADWNDTINLPGEAESLFNAHLYGRALLEFAELCDHLGLRDEADACRADHAVMRGRVQACAWDGAWWVRYFREDGEPLGSHRNAQGRIFTNGQSWPVLAGFATEAQARTALDSVLEHLNTRHGIKLSAPGYDRYDPGIGGVSTYPPGAKENGGIFLHANPWVVIAETMLGRGDRAYQYFSQINPAAKNDMIDTYEIEPYVYAQNILGDEHPQFGLGRNSWLSGTASWCFQSATQHILGIRPGHDHLVVDPCVPAAWDAFEVRRVFRGATYDIRVTNPHRAHRGVASLRVDGVQVEGNRVPLASPGSTCRVEVVLGTASGVVPLEAAVLNR